MATEIITDDQGSRRGKAEPERLTTALRAAWQIEALADCIMDSLDGTDEVGAHSIAIRIKQLAGVQMDALDDEPGRPSVYDLYKRLTGKAIPADQRKSLR